MRRAGTGRVRVVAALAATGGSALLVASLLTAGPTAFGADIGYKSAATLAADSFNRTVDHGWGSAELGSAYSVVSPSRASVAGGKGAFTLGSGVSDGATLADADALDTAVTATQAVSGLPGSGRLYLSVRARDTGSSSYTARVVVAGDGSAVLTVNRQKDSAVPALARFVLANKLQAHVGVTINLAVTGTAPVTLRARAWIDGQTKPDWQVEAIDTGSQRLTTTGGVGVWDYVSTSAPATTISTDDFLAQALTSTGPPVTPAPTSTPPMTTPPMTTSPMTTPRPVELGGSGGAGSAAVGSTSYAVPAGAVFVAGNGSDAATGTQATPLRTVNAALNKAASGGTVVVRGGNYHESISVPDRRANVTIQAYPKEAVWFDGSVALTGWKQSGSTWYYSGWNTTLDSNASFFRGRNDPSFINPSYPMAGHPDQVWVGGAAQQQVSSVSQVHIGTFYVDYTAHRIYLGTDPNGREVRSSDTIRGFYSAAASTTLRGIGFHRYAPSVADLATLRITGASSVVENVVTDDNANGGISIGGPNITVRNVSVDRNGFLGFLANGADNLTLTNSLVSANNTEHYNRIPVSGGLKIGRSRTVTISNSTFSDNVTNGLWLDESVYDPKIINNRVIGNGYYGIEVELGTKAVIAGNVVANNASNQLMVFDTSNVQVWNNTLVGSGRDFFAYQDTRTETNTSTPGHDSRRPNPDPTMSWLLGRPLVFKNNVLVSTGSDYMLVVQDGTLARNWQQIGFQSEGNVYQRAAAKTALVTSDGRNVTYTTLSNLQSATGGDRNSREVSGGAVSASYAVTAVVTALAPSSATGLPSDIAALLHTAAGAKFLGSLQG